MEDEGNIKETILGIMEKAKTVYLATIDENGFPQTRAMENLRNKELYPDMESLFLDHKDDFMSIFSTNTSSPKVGQIKSNPKVAVYYCTPNEWRGVMFGGEIEINDDPELKKALWTEGSEKYYPQGYDDPDHTVLCFKPTIVKGWNQEETFYFEIKDTN